jgi:uncharacterized RDD family membrane protein YckC
VAEPEIAEAVAPAGLARRAAAFVLDGLILAGLWIPVLIVIGLVGEPPPPERAEQAGRLARLLLGASAWAYEGLCLQWLGRTPGKALVGLRVVDRTGGPLRAWQCWLRPAVRLACHAVPYAALADYLPAAIHRGRATLHDAAARTRVRRD